MGAKVVVKLSKNYHEMREEKVERRPRRDGQLAD